MHRTTFRRRAIALATLSSLTLCLPLQAAQFSYHGDLMDGDAPAEGTYDLRLRSFANPGDAKALGEAAELPSVKLRDGHFSIEVDLPEDVDGTSWVEVAVRKAGSGEDYVTLGDPQPLSKVNSTCPGAWALDGNSGIPASSFLGTADAQDLVLKAGNIVVAHFGAANPNTLPPGNVFFGRQNFARAGVVGGVIGGGGDGFLGNIVTDDFGVIAGGQGNMAGDDSQLAPVTTNASFATVSGGGANHAAGQFSSIPGGRQNCAGGDYSWAGGRNAKVRVSNSESASLGGCVTVPISPLNNQATGDQGTFVWADSQFPDFISTGENQFLIRADGGVGINTATFGNAPNLRGSELMVRNNSFDGNTDVTLLNATQRGYLMASVPGAGGAAGEFYITETDARTATVGFTNRLRIDAAGTTFVQGGAVGNLSDARLKKNIAPIPRPLDTLLALRGHTFEYRDPAASMNAPGLRMGFIAQEVQQAIPQWVAPTGKQGYLAVTPAGFEALAVEAIRDLKAESDVRIEALESENATLRAALAALSARLERIEHAGAK